MANLGLKKTQTESKRITSGSKTEVKHGLLKIYTGQFGMKNDEMAWDLVKICE